MVSPFLAHLVFGINSQIHFVSLISLVRPSIQISDYLVDSTLGSLKQSVPLHTTIVL